MKILLQQLPISTTLILAVMLFAASCSGTKQVTVHQSAAPMELDGSLSKWNTSESLLGESEEVRYFATTHGDFLYLFVDVRDLFKDRMIRQYGLTVYVANSEETRRLVGIGYPAGTFNLLRQYPDEYNSFITDREWSHSPQSRDLIERLNEELFDMVMVVERYGGSNPEYGFVDKNLIEIDGFELATDKDRRLLSLEMKIPIDGSSLYNVTGTEDIWVGFAIEPPTFRFRDTNEYSTQSRGMHGYGYGQRQRPRHTSRQQSLPRSEDWFILRTQ